MSYEKKKLISVILGNILTPPIFMEFSSWECSDLLNTNPRSVLHLCEFFYSFNDTLYNWFWPISELWQNWRENLKTHFKIMREWFIVSLKNCILVPMQFLCNPYLPRCRVFSVSDWYFNPNQGKGVRGDGRLLQGL